MATRLTRRNEQPAERRATEVSLDGKLIDGATELGIDISRACEEGLAARLSAERSRRWQEENREAIDGYNAWVAEHGLPLEKYRLF